jgi:hypothetical protein
MRPIYARMPILFSFKKRLPGYSRMFFTVAGEVFACIVFIIVLALLILPHTKSFLPYITKVLFG